MITKDHVKKEIDQMPDGLQIHDFEIASNGTKNRKNTYDVTRFTRNKVLLTLKIIGL